VRILALLDEEPLDNTLLLHACECPKRSWPCRDLLEDGNGARSGANGVTSPGAEPSTSGQVAVMC
jgi:hypothetical protein